MNWILFVLYSAITTILYLSQNETLWLSLILWLLICTILSSTFPFIYCFLELRNNFPGVILLTIKFSLQWFIFFRWPLKLLPKRLLKSLMISFNLCKSILNAYLKISKTLLDKLELDFLDTMMIIVILLLLFFFRDLFLDMFSKCMDLVFNNISFHYSSSLLAQSSFNLLY